MRKSVAVMVLLAAAMLLASAQDAPSLPMILSGKVLIDGNEAPAGTVVKAFIDDKEVSSHT
jgi:hypothetical protein